MNIKFKKLMSVLLCCVMLFGMLPVNAFATGENTDSSFTANESGFEEPIVPDSNESSAEDPLDEASMLQPRLPEPPAGEGSEEDILSDEPGSGDDVPADEPGTGDDVPADEPGAGDDVPADEPGAGDDVLADEESGNGQTPEVPLTSPVDELFNRLMAAATYEELDDMMFAMSEEEYALMNQFSEEQNAALHARVEELSSNDIIQLDAVTLRQGDSATYTQSVERNDYSFQILKNGNPVTTTASGIKVSNAGNHTIKVETSENTPVGEYTIRFGTYYSRWHFVEAGTITLTVEEKIEADAPVVDQKKMTFDKTVTANANGNYDLKLTVSGAVGSKTNPAKVDIVLVMDKSGSMEGNILKNAKNAANTLINALNSNENIDARYNIVTFSGSSSATQGGKYVGHTVEYGTATSGWTGSASSAISYVNNISANGATNYEAGLLQAQKQLQSARSGATTIVVFLTDGLPTLRVSTYNSSDKNGYGHGSEGHDASEERCLQDAINAVAKIAMSRFYVIGTGTANASNLTRLANGAVLANKKSVKYTGDSKLSQTFSDIASDIATFLCKDVTITDTLSHVEGTNDLMVEVTDPESVKVTVYQGNNIVAGPAKEVALKATEMNAAATLTASYNAGTGVLKLDFPHWYQLEPDYIYELSAEIAPTEKAYEELRNRGYNAVGEANTGTHSGHFGFRSNDRATVTYTYQDVGSEDAYAYPVVQLNPGTLVINKTINGVDADKLSNLAFNIELTYPDGKKTTETIPFAQFADTDEDGVYTCNLDDLSPNTSYSVTEIGSELDGYLVETSATGASGTIGRGETKTASFTNKYTVATVDIPVTKVWDDANNQDGKRPASITINLMNRDNVVATKTVTAADGWAWTFEDVQKYDENGEEIEYTITENAVEHYEAAVTGNAAGFVVTNTHVPSVITISGFKTWDDAENQDGMRPEKITINLMNRDNVVATKTVTAADNWAWSFENLPEYAAGEEIKYTISEINVDGYETEINGFNVTNTHVPAVTFINVTKTWDDAENQDGMRPNSVTIDLYEDYVKTDKTLILSEGNNWSGSFEDLPVKKAGKIIRYDIAEQKVTGYETVITGSQTEGYTITNTHNPETVEVSGTKTWDDNNDQDGARPESITINLLADGAVVDTVTVTETDKWSWNFEGLAKYKDHGTLIVYSVTEEAVEDYTTEYNGYDVINTHAPEQTSVTVTKSWQDSNDQDGIRPKDITVVLMANGEETGEPLVLNDGNNWTGSFTELDKFENGKIITYTVKEIEVAGYTTAITGDQNIGYTITNTHTPETIEVSGAKTWDDNNDQDGARPESITINLLADGAVIDTVTVTETDKWSWNFEGLAKYKDHGTLIVYSVTEEAVEDYTTEYNGYDVINTHAPEQTSVTVTKSWQDSNDQDGIRPNDITVKLLANEVDTGKTLVLSEGNKWTGSFTELDKFANGKEIVYTVAEIKVPGYESVITGDQATGYTITNTHNPETVEVSGTKTWDDNNDQDGARPESITINLLADGAVIDTVTVTEADEWSWNFEGLAKYKDHGTLIVYSVTEEAVQDYTTTYNGYNVTNTHAPEKTSVTVTKSWRDNNDQDGVRPNDITVKLLADGEDTGKTLVLSEGNKWTGAFIELDKYADGEVITYTVAEVAVESYATVITGDQTTGYTITNSHTPATVEVVGSKTWEDEDNQDGFRPESITINLLADGAVIDTIIVAEADKWSWSFTNLPKYKDHGTLIVYSVTEEAVEDYTTEYNGYDVINTHAPEQTSVTVTKAWEDSNNQDGIRPSDITVKLLADGEETGKTLILNDTNNWTGSFIELDKYADGEVITYTVAENSVTGYETVITGTQDEGYIITNSHTPAVVEVAGAKTWDDKDNQDGKRPESITIKLLADGEVIDTKTVTEAEGWKWTFTNLPKFKAGKEITYTINEVVSEGYTVEIDGFNVTNKYTPAQTSVTVTKSWQDKDDQDGIRPEKITINLLADGKKVDSKKISAEDNWTYTFTKLDVYAKGVKIVYTIEEEAVDGYETVITGDAKEGFIVTNSHTPEVINIAGTKTWDDGNNQDGKRPDAITVNLLANGKVIDTVKVTSADKWTYRFTNLPRFEAGEEIIYTVTEDAVEDYTTTYDGYNIINKYTPKKTSITVTKRWVDGHNHDGIRPNSVKVILYANGKPVDTMRLSEKHNWTGVFKNLPVYQNGEHIKYTLQEKSVSGYNATITGNARKGFIVTNTHNIIPKTGDESNLPLYTGLFGAGFSAMAVLLFLAKPRKKGKYAR